MPIWITTALIGVIAALLGGWSGAAISRKSATDILEKQQFFSAASKFKATVIYELSGFYPTDQYWDENQFQRLYDSLPIINSAAAEFRYFATSKADFDKAVDEYCKYCRETYAKDVFATALPSMDYDPRKEHKGKFKNIVKHLLTFANKK